MHFENQFVGHREIDVLHQAILKMNRAECDMIDLRAGKKAVLKRAVNKGHANEVTRRKVTMLKPAALKLLEIQVITPVSYATILLLQKIGCHRRKITRFPMDI